MMFIEISEDCFMSVSSIQTIVSYGNCEDNISGCLGVHLFLKEEPGDSYCTNFKTSKSFINAINKLTHDNKFNTKLNDILEK